MEKKKKKRWIWESLEWVLRIQMWYPNHAWTLMYKDYLQELKIGKVSNSLKQLALKI
jgi:hypothetical protein